MKKKMFGAALALTKQSLLQEGRAEGLGKVRMGLVGIQDLDSLSNTRVSEAPKPNSQSLWRLNMTKNAKTMFHFVQVALVNGKNDGKSWKSSKKKQINGYTKYIFQNNYQITHTM